MTALLDAAAVAERLGVSENWVREHARGVRPALPCVHVGKFVRFRMEDIERWIAERAGIQG